MFYVLKGKKTHSPSEDMFNYKLFINSILIKFRSTNSMSVMEYILAKFRENSIRIQFCAMCQNLCEDHTIIIYLSLCHVSI